MPILIEVRKTRGFGLYSPHKSRRTPCHLFLFFHPCFGKFSYALRVDYLTPTRIKMHVLMRTLMMGMKKKTCQHLIFSTIVSFYNSWFFTHFLWNVIWSRYAHFLSGLGYGQHCVCLCIRNFTWNYGDPLFSVILWKDLGGIFRLLFDAAFKWLSSWINYRHSFKRH